MAVQHGSAGIFDPPGGGVSNGNSDFVFPRGNGSCEMGRHTAYNLHAHDSDHQNDFNSHLYASADASADFPEKSIAQRLLEWSGLSLDDLPKDSPVLQTVITPRDSEVGGGTQGPFLENPNFIGPTRKHGRGTPPSHDSNSPKRPHLEDQFPMSPIRDPHEENNFADDENMQEVPPENPPNPNFDDFWDPDAWGGWAQGVDYALEGLFCEIQRITENIPPTEINLQPVRESLLEFCNENFNNFKQNFFWSSMALRN